MGHPLPMTQAQKVIVIRRTVTVTEYIKSSEYRSPQGGHHLTDGEIRDYEVGSPDENKFEAVMWAVADGNERNIDQHVKVDVIFLHDDALRELRGR